jgi:hypothetical protein
MPTNLQGYQRIMIQGIPAWKKDENLYYYDQDVVTSPLKIGTVSEGFIKNAVELCSTKVASFRASIESRNRSANTNTAKSRK